MVWNKDCGMEVMKTMEIQETVLRCYEDSFESAPGQKFNILLDDNMLLRQEREYYQAKKVP